MKRTPPMRARLDDSGLRMARTDGWMDGWIGRVVGRQVVPTPTLSVSITPLMERISGESVRATSPPWRRPLASSDRPVPEPSFAFLIAYSFFLFSYFPKFLLKFGFGWPYCWSSTIPLIDVHVFSHKKKSKFSSQFLLLSIFFRANYTRINVYHQHF